MKTFLFKNENLTKAEILAKLKHNFCHTFAGVVSLEEDILGGRDVLYVCYKNGDVRMFENCYGTYGFPITL